MTNAPYVPDPNGRRRRSLHRRDKIEAVYYDDAVRSSYTAWFKINVVLSALGWLIRLPYLAIKHFLP